jgi:hypothetical protein
VHIEWQDPARIMPSVELVHIDSALRVSQVATRPA